MCVCACACVCVCVCVCVCACVCVCVCACVVPSSVRTRVGKYAGNMTKNNCFQPNVYKVEFGRYFPRLIFLTTGPPTHSCFSACGVCAAAAAAMRCWNIL